MEMTYDGTLVMPSNFVAVDEEEMSYVDGGVQILSSGPYVWKFRFTGSETSDIIDSLTYGGIFVVLAGAIPGVPGTFLGGVYWYHSSILTSYNSNGSGVTMTYGINTTTGTLGGPIITDNY